MRKNKRYLETEFKFEISCSKKIIFRKMFVCYIAGIHYRIQNECAVWMKLIQVEKNYELTWT